ncbi:DNA N-6-adenine-methyltransferase Dam [Pseudaminobacter salicylatoxidans]|uniref:DNA N-6-adenine-methyltransferase Dam n=1 Tax=Pseudaminobacter salicylatoxidans TaxID=93369 RepID=A0A316C0H6_PSESE|nr:DNA N-6-adenine-methyltransferase [Pseudaminobacter salicylatoxidans]PWJ81516.1 DNA N-6-adenine-methyltransferase Dam [Pseudaminobacter salicylatoxidans]
MAIGSHHSARAGTETWLTPPHVLDALGGADSFDLDPCAALNQPWPTARQHYTVEENGLIRPWRGRVWMNPPYSNSVIGRWMGRMAEHGQGIALIFARTETQVFHETVWRGADALLFLEGRLHFHDAAGVRANANAGAPSVFCAYGAADADVLASCDLPGAFVPLRLRSLIFGFASVGSWVDEVAKVIEKAGEAVHLDTLYRALADSPKAQRNRHWREKVRQSLQRGPFEPLGDGVWQMAQGRLL